MSSKDKAQEKLVASIRKTQQSAKAKNKSEQVVSTTSVKPTPAKKTKIPQKKKVMTQNNNGYYQSVNRVWPD